MARSTRGSVSKGEKKTEDGVKRLLRSKESSKMDESLFNFEESPSLLNPEEPIKLVRVLRAACTPFEEGQPIITKKLDFPINLTKIDKDANSTKRSLRNQTITKVIQSMEVRLSDPLDEIIYANYHRKMEKEEKRMANRDREKIHAEADKMRNQLEQLEQSEWAKVLPTITYIRDTKSVKEMTNKKKWTIDSLNQLLSKYEDWKRREDKLMGSVRSKSSSLLGYHHAYDLTLYSQLNKYDYIGDSDTDEEEEELGVEEINRRRLLKRTRQFGPTIKIKFGDNIVIAQPFKSTKIEKIKNQEFKTEMND